MGKVSLVDGHIDEMTNYDRIRNMSVEELARFLESTNSQTAIKVGGEYGYVVRNKKYIQRWLESEVDTK